MLLPLSLILLLATITSASNLTQALLPRSGPVFQCAILPVALSGNKPCGIGSIVSGCECCAGGTLACQSPFESCPTDGSSSCVCDYGDCSECHFQGLVDCGVGCLPAGYTCCDEVAGQGCQGDESCCGGSESGSGGSGGSGGSNSGSSITTASAPAPMTTPTTHSSTRSDVSTPTTTTTATSSGPDIGGGGGGGTSLSPAPNNELNPVPSIAAAVGRKGEGFVVVVVAGLVPALLDVL